MSTEDDALTERDAAVLDEVGPEPTESKETTEQDRLAALRAATTSHARTRTDGIQAELEDLRTQIAETRRELAEERKLRSQLEEEVERTKDDWQPADDPQTIIESYAEMDDEERRDLIGASDRRAAVLFNHWWEMAKQAGNGNWVITTHRNSTLKNNPSQVKIDLEKYTGEDLHWEEVYRAMRHLAKKSVDDTDDIETVTDESNRKHIVGGGFQYHERATPDGSDTYKVVELVDEDSLTAL